MPRSELLVFGANPPNGTEGARQLGAPHEIRYVHDTEGPRRHTFEGTERIELLPDGSIRIYDPSDKPLWDDF